MKTLKDISKIRNVTLVNDVRETPRFWGDERAEGKGIEINVEALNPRLRFSGKMIVPPLDLTQDFIGITPGSIESYAESYENQGMTIDGIYVYIKPFESKGFKRQSPNHIQEYNPRVLN